jgi:RNA polymerase sigma factor (sigma-70 family)
MPFARSSSDVTLEETDASGRDRPGLSGIGASGEDLPGFRAVYLAHHPSIYRFLFRMVGVRAEAEDLAQEVFLRYYRKFHSGAGDHLRPWLYRVAMNLAHNSRRDWLRLTRRHFLAGGAGETLGEGPADPARSLERAAERDRVRSVLDGLPARAQRLLSLRYAGLSYEEIAIALELPATSVGKLLSRAEDAFRKAYLEQTREDV